MGQAYKTIYELVSMKKGFLVDYSSLKNNYQSILSDLFHYIWPESDHDENYALAGAIQAVTGRGERLKTMATPFFGKNPGEIEGGEIQLFDLFEKQDYEIASCDEYYKTLLNKSKQ